MVAGGDLGERVAHMQADPFLADHDRADIRLGGGLDDRIDRIADQKLVPSRFRISATALATFMGTLLGPAAVSRRL